MLISRTTGKPDVYAIRSLCRRRIFFKRDGVDPSNLRFKNVLHASSAIASTGCCDAFAERVTLNATQEEALVCRECLSHVDDALVLQSHAALVRVLRSNGCPMPNACSDEVMYYIERLIPGPFPA